MLSSDIERINALARKAKTTGLTEEEKTEQAALRAAYIKAFRDDLKRTLDHVSIQEQDGTIRPLKPKKQQEQ